MNICMAILLILLSGDACAFSWQDLWLTRDQQAKKLMDKKEFGKAQSLFEQPDWRATAAYRDGDFKQAARDFQDYYNQGNALARLGQYEQAIAAYDKSLVLNAANEDAVFNRKLVADLLKKQQEKKQQEQQNNSKKQQNQSDKSQNKQSSSDQKKEQGGKPSGKDQKDKQDKQDKQKQKGNNRQPSPPAPLPQAGEGSKKLQASEKQTQAEREKQQAKEQWLHLIPDDPGGLMREKFLRDHLRRQGGWYQQ